MGVTAFFKFRYPDPTDPVQAGPTNFQNLARDVEAVVPAMVADVTAFTFNAVAQVTVAIVFPAGRFTTPPVVTGIADGNYFLQVAAITVNGCNLTMRTISGATTSGTNNGYWVAVERRQIRP